VLAASHTTGKAFFKERIGDVPVHIVEDDLHNAIGHADLALVASGTAAVETALLGTPMVVFYRVTQATWVLGKMLTDVPFFSMVNLLAGRRIVPELIQQGCTADKLASEAKRLLENDQERQLMRRELSVIAEILSGDQPAAERAAEVICKKLSWTGDRNIQPVAVS
jgi:lipid-A-disaccharide synthase